MRRWARSPGNALRRCPQHPARVVRFEKLLATAQRFAPLREEQVSHFTLGRPLIRRALYRLGGHLRKHGAIAEEKDIFFLKRDELLTALNAADEPRSCSRIVTRRRHAWQRSRRLTPPLVLGEPLSSMARKSFDEMEATFRPDWHATANGIHGLPASPGRTTGRGRIVRALEEFDRLEPGDILMIPAATPTWTPLFAYAAAIVADTGSPVAHASLVAREYGIPAVVGAGNATARLRDGQVVTVDGNTGLVEAQP